MYSKIQSFSNLKKEALYIQWLHWTKPRLDSSMANLKSSFHNLFNPIVPGANKFCWNRTKSVFQSLAAKSFSYSFSIFVVRPLNISENWLWNSTNLGILTMMNYFDSSVWDSNIRLLPSVPFQLHRILHCLTLVYDSTIISHMLLRE